MADEQIRIDITATDDASDQLDDVADKADDLERLEPEITVEADTEQASRAIDDVADDAEQLERVSPELTVTADTDAASRAIDDVRSDAKELSGKDVEILLKAKIDDARGQLKALRDNLDQTSDKADDTARHMDKIGGEGGLKTRGNAIADLTGPLGEASSAASDFAGVFDGIGDIAEDVAAKVGLNAAAMSTAIGGIGIAVAAAAALWSLWTGNQAKVREQQKELLDGQKEINDAIAEGNNQAAASKLLDLYKDAFDAADQLGIRTQDVAEFILGMRDSVGLTEDQFKKLGSTEMVMYDQLIGDIEKSRRKYVDTNGTLRQQRDRVDEVADAFGNMADDAGTAMDRIQRESKDTESAIEGIRGSLDMEGAFLRFEDQMSRAMTNTQTGAHNTAQDILDLKLSILDVAKFAQLTPVQVKTLLGAVDRGDLNSVRRQVENYYNGFPVNITTRLFGTPENVGEYVRTTQRAVGTIPIATRLTTAGNSGLLYNGPR